VAENGSSLSASQLAPAKKSKLEDTYELGQVLGEGAYGAVRDYERSEFVGQDAYDLMVHGIIGI
jgi:hypothetical protein